MAERKERPVVALCPMVRALLENRKTQMRSVVKPQPGASVEICVFEDRFACMGLIGDVPEKFRKPFCCPYGEKGDRLWVRETIGINMLSCSGDFGSRVYKATQRIDPNFPIRWLSPMHMPREASRITLEITSRRVERLQSISENDAKAEGIILEHYNSMHRINTSEPYRHCYEYLWGTKNARNAKYGWSANPLVWVISFKRAGNVE